VGRLGILDAFRGADRSDGAGQPAGDGQHVHAPLRHAEWDGWTPTDVVFPSFMWIAG
jgi:predicted acyltransferase